MSVSFCFTLVHYEYHSFHVIRSKHVRSETQEKGNKNESHKSRNCQKNNQRLK